MEYSPLVHVWGIHGQAAVVFAALQDAGFHPITECDLRGWMHFYKWPQGSERPVTIWISESERSEALAYLAAPVEVAAQDDAEYDGFWAALRNHRRGCYAGWLAAWFVTGY